MKTRVGALPVGPLDTPIDVLDRRFAAIVAHQPRLQRLCTGARWSEGPVWMREDDSVLWSDIPNDRMLRWSAADGMQVWRDHVEFTNGHTRDHDGTLLHCSHGLRAVYRTAPDGSGRTIVVDRWQGRRLNSPNDIVVKSDGTLWFTDPPYGLIIPRRAMAGNRRSAIATCSASIPRAVHSNPSPTCRSSRTDSPSRRTSGRCTCRIRRQRSDARRPATIASSRSTSSAGDRTQVRRRVARRPGWIPSRRAGLDLHERRGRRTRVRFHRNATRTDRRAGESRQRHLRRGATRHPLHRRVDVALSHTPRHPRDSAPVRLNRP